jgi:hypothetical protein
MPWIARKRVAVIPIFRPHAIPPDQIPPDYGNSILSRVIYDPDPRLGGADGSLRLAAGDVLRTRGYRSAAELRADDHGAVVGDAAVRRIRRSSEP